MIAPLKRKLSAKQILADIRSGMDPSGLKRKYALSDKALESVCTQLAAKGMLTDHEIRRLRPPRVPSAESPKIPKRPRWHCPACNAPQATEMSECPACGVVVEKFVERRGEANQVFGTPTHDSRDIGPSERTGWMPIITSIVVFAIAGTCLLLWSTHRSKEAHKVSELDPMAQSLAQAETETGQAQEDSGDPKDAGKDHSEVETGSAKDIVLFQPPVVAIPQKTPEPAVVAPREDTSQPREESSPPPEKPRYVTGVLRQFSSRDFKKEVVEASKTHPVLFQFYSQT